MLKTLVASIAELNAHRLSNPDDYLTLTDPGFLKTTDEQSAELIDAVVTAARDALGDGEGGINRRALTSLKKKCEANEAGSPYDPTITAVVISTSHGQVVVDF